MNTLLDAAVRCFAGNLRHCLQALALFAAGTCLVHAGTTRITATYDLDLNVDSPSRLLMQPDVKSVLIGAGFGILNGNVHVGVVEETLTFTDNKFDIRSVGKPAEIVAKVFKNATIVRQSDGNISAGRFFTARYMERRGESYEKTAVIDTRGKKVHFYDGQNLVADSPLPGGVTDNLSFPYAFLGRKMPAAPIHAVATDGRTMRPMTFDVSEEMLVIGKQNYPAVKLRRRKIESDDAGIELWFLRGSNFPLRVRVEMSQKYGVIVDQTLRGAPAVL